MFSDDEIKRAYRLSYFLHPDNVVAYSITLDAFDRFWLLQKQQERRYASDKSFKLPLPHNLLLQSSIYLASDEWERDQESARPLKPYTYGVNRDDLIIRYVKLLIWETMGRKSCNAAIGLGCLLHSYNTTQIHHLAPDIFNEHNLRRSKSRLVARIEERFKKWGLISEEQKNLRSRLPSKYEQGLIQKTLHTLAPWLPDGFAHQAYSGDLLEYYFGYLSSRTEWERNHVLIDPYCGGFQRLIREYNANLSKESEEMRLEDPDEKLEVPDFGVDSGGSGPDDRFTPPTLSTNEVISIKRSLQQNQRRRATFRGDKLRARVDGDEYLLSAKDGYFCGQVRLQPNASYIELFGEDEDGDILLAIFYIQEFDGAGEDNKKELFARTEGGQEITCVVSPVRGATGEVTEMAIEVTYVGDAAEAGQEYDAVSPQPGMQKIGISGTAGRRSASQREKRTMTVIRDGGAYTRLLWRLAGASSWVLDKQDLALARSKYTATGMSILCTTLLAALSGGYALYLVFGSSVTALIGGLFWGVIIASLDRFILTTIRRDDKENRYKQFAVALPRLILGLLISVIVVIPLELRLFEGEIQEKVAKARMESRVQANQHMKAVFPELPTLEQWISRLEDKIDKKMMERDNLYRAAIDEVEGTAGSRRQGKGAVFSAKMAQLKKVEDELRSLRLENEQQIAEYSRKLNELDKERKDLVDRTVPESVGLLARITALKQLSEENNVVGTLTLLLALLLCMVTTVPVLVQMLAKPGLYDHCIDIMEEAAKRKFEQDFEGVSAQELEEKLEEVTNLVRFRSRVA